MAACEYQLPSNWRISRRRTWSAVRVLPLNTMRRTLTRGPGCTCKSIADGALLAIDLGTGLTLAKA
jgi:hypothetical protein